MKILQKSTHGVIHKTIVFLLTIIVAIVSAIFSIAIFVGVLVLVFTVGVYLWWRTRQLRRQATDIPLYESYTRTENAHYAGNTDFGSYENDGVIEGEIIHDKEQKQ